MIIFTFSMLRDGLPGLWAGGPLGGNPTFCSAASPLARPRSSGWRYGVPERPTAQSGQGCGGWDGHVAVEGFGGTPIPWNEGAPFPVPPSEWAALAEDHDARHRAVVQRWFPL